MMGIGTLTNRAQHVELIRLANLIMPSIDGLEKAVLPGRKSIANKKVKPKNGILVRELRFN